MFFLPINFYEKCIIIIFKYFIGNFSNKKPKMKEKKRRDGERGTDYAHLLVMFVVCCHQAEPRGEVIRA
jgi:hypothetical protein